MSTKDYKDFTDVAPIAPPTALSRRVLAEIHRDLSPSNGSVFFKLFAIHAATALVVLSLCPQFGIRLLGEGPGLMGYFMVFGTVGCMVACGSFFLAASIVVATLLLRPEELRTVRKYRWREIGSLAVLSLGFFFSVNPEIILSVALFWLMGALGGAFIALEVGWHLRVGRLRLAKN